VLAGLAAALVTVLARRSNDSGLAGAAAILSLVIALLLTIFIVPPLARSARVEVASLDFPFEPTSGGGVFLVIIIVVGFAAWNTGNNLLFLVFSLLCSTLFVGWVAARASLRDLTVSARFPDHIFAAEPAPVIVTLRNTKRVLPSFSILVEARGPGSDEAENKKRRRQYVKRSLAYFSYVPHHAAAEQRVEQLFPTRGHVLIDGFELSTRFPFGFFRRRRRLRARNEARRILVVISDGTPMDEATLAANGHEYLETHLQVVVEDIESASPTRRWRGGGRSRVQLAAIGIGHDVSLIYSNATTVASIEQLGPALSQKLTALLGSE